MCTMIASKTEIAGSGKAGSGWFAVDRLYLGYDHPVHLGADHAISLDFVNEQQGPGARVAVELSRDDARRLLEQLAATLAQADAYEGEASSAKTMIVPE